MGVLLGLASAVFYGIADFAGGLLSRRAAFAVVALLGQAGGLVVTLATAPMVSSTAPAWPDLFWGGLSGVGTGLGMVFLYRGLGRGAMSVVVPVSAVGGLALPVLIGVAFLGDRPSGLAWLGAGLAVPALWLISRAPGGSGDGASSAMIDGLMAGGGIAVQYLALAQAGSASGIWPVAAGRLTATLTILPLALPALPRFHWKSWFTAAAAVNGAAAAVALVCYLLATRQQMVVIAVVLSSLYPAIPVLLGVTALRERLTLTQGAGLLGAALAVGLLTFG